jgi:integrase
VVKHKGRGEKIIIGPPKGGRPRVVDLDPATLAALKTHKATQGTLSLALARDGAYILARLDGGLRHPERFSRKFVAAVVAARRALGSDGLSMIRLHDLRHTHATLLLAAGIPVRVVSERLGHASATITLGIYAHVMPGMQAQAAAKFGALMAGGAS